MLWWWFWVWIVFVVLLIVLPVGYGWGYRGWGAPYPRYRYRARRGKIVELEEVEPPAEPAPRRGDGWGVVADVVWLCILGAIIWIVVWAWA
ncbi:MAG TPA: hypothetical protein VFA19_09425 [Gaiellaceae bacterium]|nr:hypothetical protein [Gaiellaceae bacterium]